MRVLALSATVFMASFLVACGAHKQGFAPKPPSFHVSNYSHQSIVPRSNAADHNIKPAALGHIAPAAGSVMASHSRTVLLPEETSKKAAAAPMALDCSIKDRFDRDDLVAYEWGQNRLGFDVDGIGLTDMDLEAVRVTFSMNLQPIKTKKQKCRGGSAWQGMVGSGYNELVVNDGAALKKEWRELRRDIDDRLSYFIE